MSESLLSLAERLFETPATSVVLTWFAYEIGRSAQARCRGSVLANPVLIAALLIVPVLEMAGVSYERYMRGAGFIHFLLGPAAVALAVPIYDNADRIRRAAARLLVGIGVGATVACVSAVVLAWLLGASADVVRSIAPKSVTTPIAQMISIDKTAGAFAGLAIGLTGLFTAILLPIAVRLLPLILPD